MSVTGLILGCVFLLSNLQMNGHLNTRTTNYVAPVYKDASVLRIEIVRLEHKDNSESKNEFEIQAEATNISERPIRAFKGRIKIKDIFGEQITYIDIVHSDTLLPGGKTSASQSVKDSDFGGYDSYDRLRDAGKIENLKVEFQALEIIYDN